MSDTPFITDKQVRDAVESLKKSSDKNDEVVQRILNFLDANTVQLADAIDPD